MKTIQLSHQYRPLKIAYAVKFHEAEQLRDAIQRATMTVGGIYNPIIPVGVSSEAQKALLRLFKPDVVENLAKLELPAILTTPRYAWEKYGRDRTYDILSGDLHINVLDVSHILRQLQESRQLRTKKDSRAVVAKWDKESSRSLMYAAELGEYAEFKNADFRAAFTEILPARELEIKDTKSAIDAIASYTPLNLTSHGLVLQRRNLGASDSGYYMGDPKNVLDIINFWNIRAAGGEVIFVDATDGDGVAVAKGASKVLAEQSQYRAYLRNVWYRSDLGVTEDTLRQHGSELVNDPWYERIENGVWVSSNRDATPELRLDSRQFVIGQLEPFDDDQVIVFSKPSLPYKIPSQHFHSPQILVSNISNTLGLYNTQSDIVLPAWDELTDWATLKLTVGHDKPVRLKEGAVEFFTDTSDHIERITPVKDEALIHQMFELCGMKLKDSTAGILAEKLVSRMGGLEDCRVFKVRGVRNLIESTDVAANVQYSTAKQIINDQAADGTFGFEKFKRLYIDRRKAQFLTPDGCIDYMLKQSILKAGYELQCQSCTLPFWVSLEAASDYVKCEYCFEVNHMAVAVHTRGDISYRRSGLFGRDNNLEGGVTVILSLMQLNHLGAVMEAKHTMSKKILSKELGIDCETDLIALGKSKGSRPGILIGECKTNKAISWDDALNLMQVAKILRSRGLSPYILMAKLGDLTKDEIKMFKHMANDGFSPLIFTREELEPYDLNDAYRDRLPKNMHPFNFGDIAEISAHLYLDK